MVSLPGWNERSSATEDSHAGTGTVTLASGTTPEDSGLLAHLHPGFEDWFGADVDAVIRGTGGALRTARNGDCDVVFVHARPLEDAFLRDGSGINRRSVMVNDFLVVGPPEDPAEIAGREPVAAFRRIANADATFVSRGDRSGTHLRERRLWTEAGIAPTGPWYLEAGQGMGHTLTLAGERNAYTLTDRGSFLNVATGDGLAALVDRGIDDPPPLLRNEYAVIPVNPARHDVAYQLGMAYVGYLTGPGQSRIEAFRIDGQRGYRPIDRDIEPDFHQYLPADWHG